MQDNRLVVKSLIYAEFTLSLDFMIESPCSVTPSQMDHRSDRAIHLMK